MCVYTLDLFAPLLLDSLRKIRRKICVWAEFCLAKVRIKGAADKNSMHCQVMLLLVLLEHWKKISTLFLREIQNLMRSETNLYEKKSFWKNFIVELCYKNSSNTVAPRQ